MGVKNSSSPQKIKTSKKNANSPENRKFPKIENPSSGINPDIKMLKNKPSGTPIRIRVPPLDEKYMPDRFQALPETKTPLKN